MATDNQKLALEMNWHKRQCMGAIGTVTPRFTRRNFNREQQRALTAIVINAQHIVTLLKMHVDSIEEFWLQHGSERIKRELARKIELREKADAWFRGNGPDLTEKEWNTVYGKRKPANHGGNNGLNKLP